MKWLKWPFKLRFNFSFSVGDEPYSYELGPLHERALRWATDRNPADSLSAEAAVASAEVYLEYLKKFK